MEPLRKGWKRFNGIKDSSTGSKEFSSKPIRGSAPHFLAQRFLRVQLLGPLVQLLRPLVQLLRPTRCAQRAGPLFSVGRVRVDIRVETRVTLSYAGPECP